MKAKMFAFFGVVKNIQLHNTCRNDFGTNFMKSILKYPKFLKFKARFLKNTHFSMTTGQQCDPKKDVDLRNYYTKSIYLFKLDKYIIQIRQSPS